MRLDLVLGNALWIAVEAKSGQQPTGLIAHKYVRHAGDQLRLLASDRSQDAAPPGSITVMVSPKPAVDPEAAKGAEPHLHLVHPDAIMELAHDVQAAWTDILGGRADKTLDQLKTLVRVKFNQRGILPTQAWERLTPTP